MYINLYIIEVKNITCFIHDNTKDKNDDTNRLREKIIVNIFTISEDYFNDPEFGHYWTNIREKLYNTINILCSVSYHHFIIKQKGGMNYNYDFDIIYFDVNNCEVENVKMEFKHNKSNVKDLVQFLELYDKDCKNKYNLFDYSYSEYYYDKFIDEYLAIDGDTTITKPNKETYLQNIYNIKYQHPFFSYLYNEKNKNKIKKNKLVEESRNQFIQQYAHSFNFHKITEKIKESQLNKVFILWDKMEFHVEKLELKDINIVGIKPNSINKLYFDVIVDNYIYDIRIRLNWGNNNGVANPRWKFSFIDK